MAEGSMKKEEEGVIMARVGRDRTIIMRGIEMLNMREAIRKEIKRATASVTITMNPKATKTTKRKATKN